MNIIKIDYTLKYESLDVYVAGCKAIPKCEGCHNPESWGFNQGYAYDQNVLKYIQVQVDDFGEMIDRFMIFGGEPLDQDHDMLIQLLTDLRTFNKDIWLFTRFEIQDVPKKIQSLCDYIKTGRYDKKNACEDKFKYGIKLASKNQKIYKIRMRKGDK